MKGYSAVIIIMMSVLCYFIFSRSDMDMTVMRSAGMLYQEQPGGYISNIYNAEVINKSNHNKVITIKAEDPSIKIKYIQAPGIINKGSGVKTMFFIMMPTSKILQPKTTIRLQLISDRQLVQTVSTNFVGPIN
ncbi:FixG Ig-like domain-containing protein [Mucilaginibacter antarcticus]